MSYTNNKFYLLFCIFCMLFLRSSTKDQTDNLLAKLLPQTTTISNYDYDQPSDCECSNSTLYLNIENPHVTLNPTNSDNFCLNMSCSWYIFIEYKTSMDFLSITYSEYKVFNMVKITNCENNVNFMSLAQLELITLITQETEICVTFNSYKPSGNINDQTWNMNFDYNADQINFSKIILNENQPVTSFTLIPINDFFCIIAETTYGTIEMGAVMLNPSDYDTALLNIYDATNLTNLVDIYNISKQNYTQIASESGHLTTYFWNDFTDSYQFDYRSKELHSANCNTTENLQYAYPWKKTINFSIAATSKGKCLFSIVPSASQNSSVDNQQYYIHILQIVRLTYKGPGKVAVVSGCNETFTLFDFSNETYNLWNDTVVYGELISFIIPPYGKLYIEYENLNMVDKLNKVFDSYVTGIIQSVAYPLPNFGQNFKQNIQSQSLDGYASFNITIVFAEISNGGHLQIYSGDHIALNVEDKNLIENKTIRLFNGSDIFIVYDQGNYITRGALIRYEGTFVPFIKPTPGSAVKKSIVWVIVVGSLVIAVLIVILITCYCFKRKKDLERMDFIIDIMKTEKQLSPEEIEDLKEKRDEFTIPKKKLKMYYEMPLGDGVSSTVYIGFIHGKSPLSITTNLIETQRFQDCKVAVKVPSTFGSDESDQLFREIDSMKKIGYHQNVICMLGVCFLNEKPVVAFELADKDLLEYVKSLTEDNIEKTYFSPKIFFSILWQVAKGMQYIASKSIVHRDLAARNILLTDSFNAKISDFGLSCSTNNSARDEGFLPKKLPFKWLSIEALRSKIFSEKSDVWAFGVLMFEVFSFGQVPYPALGLNDLKEFLKAGNRLSCPQAATEEIYEIMLNCWNEYPEERPTFETLVNVFHGILEKATKSYGYVESSMDE